MVKTFLSILLFMMLVGATSAQTVEKGWKELFDGKTLNGWKKLAGTAEYRVEDGAIVGITVPSSPNTFLVSEEEYGDFILELDVKLEDTTINSGIQFKSHFSFHISSVYLV